MSRTFTDEKFTGYEFRCETTSANTGFKHVCRVFKDNEEVEEAKSVVNWGNRTWEPYQYASVFEESKARLTDILAGNTKEEYDTEILDKLANYDYIHDYGYMEDGELVILMDSWSQVDGDSHYEDEHDEEGNYTGFHKVIDRPSVYRKLVELAEKNLLKPSYNKTIKEVEYVFTDQYDKCWECGTVHSTEYGDLTYVDEIGMLLCDKCINTSDNVQVLVDEAVEDFRQALKPTVNQDIIEDLGYTLVTDETFSFEREYWGAVYMTEEFAEDFCNRYNGFAQIYAVAQFVVPFQLWVPNDRLEEAREELTEKFNLAEV